MYARAQQLVWRLVLCGFVCVAAGALAYLLAAWLRPSQVAKEPAASLVVDPAGLDLGAVWATKSHPWTIQIRNTGSEPVTIGSFSTTCSCSQVDPTSVTIPAGAGRKIRLTVDLFVASSNAGDGNEIPVKLSVSPRIAGRRGEEISWVLNCLVRKPVVVSATGLSFGRHSELAQPLKPVEATLTLHPDIKAVEASVARSDLAVTLREEKNRPRSVQVTFPGGLRPGPVSSKVRLVAVTADGRRLEPLEVPLFGSVEVDVRGTPDTLEFGPLAPGDVREQVVTLDSMTRTPFSVTTVRPEGEGLSLVPSRRKGEPAYRIRQVGKAGGDHGGHVVFTVAVRGLVREVRVPVSYYGLSGENAMRGGGEMTYWRSDLMLLAWWAAMVVRVSAADNPPFTIADLKAAWQARQDRFEQVEAKWTSKKFRPRGAMSGSIPPPLLAEMGPPPPDAVIPPADFTRIITNSLILQGGKARWREEGRYRENGIGEELDHWYEACFDGLVLRKQRSIHKAAVSYPQGGVHKQPYFTDADNIDIRPLMLYSRPMQRGFQPLPIDAFLITGRTALIDGGRCAALEQASRSMTIWVDPATDYVIRRLVVDRRPQGAIFQYDIRYAEADGRVRLAGWTYREHSAANRLISSSEVTDLALDQQAELGKDAFVLSFLPRAYVFDDLTKESYIILEDGTKRGVRPSEAGVGYEKLAATNPGGDAPRAWSFFGFSWLGLLAVCGVAALLCLLLRAYFRLRASPR